MISHRNLINNANAYKGKKSMFHIETTIAGFRGGYQKPVDMALDPQRSLYSYKGGPSTQKIELTIIKLRNKTAYEMNFNLFYKLFC